MVKTKLQALREQAMATKLKTEERRAIKQSLMEYIKKNPLQAVGVTVVADDNESSK